MASLSVASGGLESLSSGVAASLAGQETNDSFQFMTQAVSESFRITFSDGSEGWTGDGSITAVQGFGDVFVIDPEGTVSRTVDIPAGTQLAVLTFDLIGADSLNGEPSIIEINGETVGIAYIDYGEAVFQPAVGSSASAVVAASGGNFGAWSDPDAVLAIALEVEDPGSTLTLSVSSGANASYFNEFYAIDNFTFDAS